MSKNKVGQGAKSTQQVAKAISAIEMPAMANELALFKNRKRLMFLLAIAALVAFVGGFGNDFVQWDDNSYITGNPLVQHPTLANLVRLLRVECAYNFHPLTMASLWLNSALAGTAATSFIITNTILHVVNTLLVFVLAGKLAKGDLVIAFFTALLWGVHPMHTESVTWISERKDVLYTLFFFGSCIQYVKFTEGGKRKYWISALLLFLLSCLAKGMAVVLPLVLILIDYWYEKKPSAKQLTNKAPFFILALLFGLLTIHVQSGGDLGGMIERLTTSGESAIKDSLTIVQRFCFGFYAFCIYILKFFVPLHQHNFYAYPLPTEYYNAQYLAAPIVALALLVYTVSQYKKNKLLFFGVMFFLCTIITVLQFVSVGVAIVSERYTYIPYFGLVFVVVCWVRQKLDHKKMSLALSGISVVFICLAFLQTQTYKQTEALFLNSWRYEPGSSSVGEVLTNYYGERGEFRKAVEYGEAVARSGATSWRQMEVLSKAYYFSGNVKKSVATWEKVMTSVPDAYKSAVYVERGMMLRAAHMYVQSVRDFETAIMYAKYRGTGDSIQFVSSMFYEKGLTDRLGGNYDRAIADFERAINLNGVAVDSVLREKAYCRLLARDWQGAIGDYSQMIMRGISVDTAYHYRGCARYKLGQKDSAIADIKTALRINPNNSAARNNLAIMQR